MKEVRAYVQTFMLEHVIEALLAIPGFPGISVMDARGFGSARAAPHEAGPAEELTDFTPKVRLEIVVTEDLADRVIQAIAGAARTGNRGDGKIFVSDVERALRVRMDEAAGRGRGRFRGRG